MSCAVAGSHKGTSAASDATALQVARRAAMHAVQIDVVVVAGLAVAQWHAVTLGVVVILIPFRRGQNLAVAAATRHGVGLGTGVVDHGG